MNTRRLFKSLALIQIFMLGWQLPAYGALTDISNTPLSAPNTSVVRPNLMFVLDDSGSMEQDYTPDAAAQNYLGYGSPDKWCYDSGDDGTSGVLETSDASTNRNDVCRTGDVPYYSPDTNFQYYNPDVTYTRPVCYNGVCATYPDITPTAAKTDGYGIRNKNQLGTTVTTINLTNQYPERVWCDSTGATATDTDHCKTNTAPSGSNAYLYPGVGFAYGKDGSGNFKYKNSAPHYFRLQVSEYCTTEDLIDCTAATSPTGTYVYPARIRWCQNASQTGLAVASTGCQARYDKNHSVPRYLGKVVAASAGSKSKATFTVSSAPTTHSISQILVDGVNIINTIINGTGSTTTTAQAICNAINSYVSTPDYTAGTGTTSTTSCGTSSSQINVAAADLGTAANTKVLTVTGPAELAPTFATGSITVSSTGSTSPGAKTARITSIKVGAVSIATGPLTFTDGTNTVAVAQSICNAINSLASSPDFKATTDGSADPLTGGCTTSGSVVYIKATSSGTGGNGTLTVDTTGAAASPTGTLTFGSVNTGTSTTKVQIDDTCPAEVGDITIMGTTVSASGSTSSTRRNNMASGVRANINTLTGTTGFSASSSNEVVTATAPAGSFYNGLRMCATVSGSISWSSAAFANGRDAQPTTNTNMSGGASADGTITTTAPATLLGGADGNENQRTGTGTWERTDIVPSVTTYPKASTRTDCAAADACTYTEELQNFANWYGYYRTRMNLMKTAVGQTFLDIDDDFRVGFITINVGSSSSKYLKLAKFDSTQKSSWYSKLYAQAPGSSTPLREALSRVGRYYGGKTDGINAITSDDPVEYECQQCFTLLTTDGFWNGNAGQKLDGTAIGNQDNADSVARPYYDGGTTTNASDTLADVAYYYYNTDLRGDFDNRVPDIEDKSHRDRPQHMVTYTLGLGVNGNMIYKDDYKEPTTTADYRYVATTTARNSSNCTWQTSGTNCEWAKPAADDETAVDDLWHAAVNGHGKYFSARNPQSLSAGLRSALEEMRGQVGAAAAAATSNANIKSGDNYVYSATFTTIEWTGEVVAQEINITTGEVLPTKLWSAQDKLEAQVGTSTDSRNIYMFDATETNKLSAFTWSELTGAGFNGYFSNGCVASTGHTALLQCASLDAGQKTIVNNGEYMVNFLRGQREYEDGILFRDRAKVLGDAAHSTPAYVRVPLYEFADAVSPSYTNFKTSNATRQEMLYIAANDGFLHAINASNDGSGGTEVWAYAPRVVFPNMYHLADTQYADNHRYYVDGTPQVMDIFDGTAWRTILVGSLGAGGRGYFALDITVPNSPKALWERCSDSTFCPDVGGLDMSDEDMGLSYGVPVITKLPSTSSHPNEWVVIYTSGYNNVSPGDGEGHLYVVKALTGELLYKVDTNEGTTATPSGLAKIAAWAENANTDNTSKWIYGGDLLGNMWKFDLTQATPTASKLGQALDDSGAVQAITSRPELGKVSDFADPVILFGTGRYLGACDVDFETGCPTPDVTTQVQTVYAIKDRIYSSDGTTSGTYYANGLRDADAGLVEQVLSETTVDGETIRVVNAPDPVDWSDPAVGGWYIDLSLSTGERVDVDPQLVLGTLVVVGNVPEAGSSNACSVGGSSWLYQFSFESGGYLEALSSTKQVGGRVSDSALTVGIVVFRLPGGALKALATDATGSMQDIAVTTESPGTAPRRSSWREIIR